MDRVYASNLPRVDRSGGAGGETFNENALGATCGGEPGLGHGIVNILRLIPSLDTRRTQPDLDTMLGIKAPGLTHSGPMRPSTCKHRIYPPSSYTPWRIKSAIRSPMTMVVTLVLARIQSGMIEASATRKPSMPWTRPN
jgi:hypothetical protein